MQGWKLGTDITKDAAKSEMFVALFNLVEDGSTKSISKKMTIYEKTTGSLSSVHLNPNECRNFRNVGAGTNLSSEIESDGFEHSHFNVKSGNRRHVHQSIKSEQIPESVFRAPKYRITI